jgi:tRNA (guanine-N7-)-methyltransferase
MIQASTNTKERAETRFIEPDNWFERLDWKAWFPSPHPVEIDLGAGDGGFVAARAQAHPDTNFIAVERLLGRARKIDRKSRRLGLSNLRVIRMETLYTIRWLVPEASVRAFHLLFPDPWPKKKHHKHRVIRGEFLDAVERALEPGGLFFAATDHAEYFEEIIAAFRGRAGWKSGKVSDEEWFPEKTDFERHFLKEGKAIGRMRAVWRGRD